ASWAAVSRSLLRQAKLPRPVLAEPGLLALRAYLANNRGIKSSMRGQPFCRLPVALVGHRLDHFLGVERCPSLREHLGPGVQGAQLALRLGGLGLLFLGAGLGDALRLFVGLLCPTNLFPAVEALLRCRGALDRFL